jgi:hypothetical protein
VFSDALAKPMDSIKINKIKIILFNYSPTFFYCMIKINMNKIY